MADITEEYQEIFHNIELNVVNYYRAYPSLSDHQVDKVYEAIERIHEKQLQGKNPPKLRWKDNEEDLFHLLMAISELLLGETLKTQEGEDFDLPTDPISKELLIKIMKRLRSSVKLWTGSSAYGRQGYLNYISNFM